MIQIHVKRNRRRWVVELDGEEITSAEDSVAAEIVARRMLEDQGGGELVLHADAGRPPRFIRVATR